MIKDSMRGHHQVKFLVPKRRRNSLGHQPLKRERLKAPAKQRHRTIGGDVHLGMRETIQNESRHPRQSTMVYKKGGRKHAGTCENLNSKEIVGNFIREKFLTRDRGWRERGVRCDFHLDKYNARRINVGAAKCLSPDLGRAGWGPGVYEGTDGLPPTSTRISHVFARKN